MVLQASADAEPQVRAVAWHALAQVIRSTRGDTAWRTALDASGLPPPDRVPETALVPTKSLLSAGATLAGPQSEAGRRLEREAGAATAHRLLAEYEPLVQQFRGQPQKLAQLFATHFHPYLFPSRAPPHLGPGTHNALHVSMDRALPSEFLRGLFEAVVERAGGEPTTRWSTEGLLHVAWKLRTSPAANQRSRLAAAILRPPFLVATILPVLVALAIAAQDGAFHPVWALATLVGVAAFQLGTNALNEYYDQRPTPPIPAAPPERRLKTLAYGFYALGTALGLALVAVRGIEVLWLGLAGFLLGFLYSAPPVRLAHRGLGELAVAVGFGPLIVLGTYFVQHQSWSLEAMLASLPLAFLIAAVLYINEFPDKDGDARVGKRTLIVRLPETAAVVGYVLLLAFTYAAILGGVALNSWPRYRAYAFPLGSLLGLLTLPLAVKASLALARNYRYPYRLVEAHRATVLLHVTTGVLFCSGYLWTRVTV